MNIRLTAYKEYLNKEEKSQSTIERMWNPCNGLQIGACCWGFGNRSI